MGWVGDCSEVGWRSWGNCFITMRSTTRRTTNNASRTSKRVMTSARKSNGKVIGRRSGIDASVVMRERGVPSTIIDRFKYSLARILELFFEDWCVCLAMVSKSLRCLVELSTLLYTHTTIR